MILLKIALCDDSREDLERIRSSVSRILFSRAEYEITCYQDGLELVKAVEGGTFDCDLIFLDVNMQGMNGMDTAAYIRKRKLDADIIFVTVSGDHVYEGYTYRAYAYILKSMLDQSLERELKRYLDERMECPETLNISVRGSLYQIPLDRILYFESNVRKILIHIQGGEVMEYYGKLGELEELLGEKSFLRCHQSYLVNWKYVTAVSRAGVSLPNENLPVSRRYWEILKGEEAPQQAGEREDKAYAKL